MSNDAEVRDLRAAQERLWDAYQHLRDEKARLERELLPTLPASLKNRSHALMALYLIDKLTRGGSFGSGVVLMSRFDLADLGAPIEDCFERRDYGGPLAPEDAVAEVWRWCPLRPGQSQSAFLRWLKDWRRKLAAQGHRVPYSGPFPREV